MDVPGPFPNDPPDVIRRRHELYSDDIVGAFARVGIESLTYLDTFLSSFENAVYVRGRARSEAIYAEYICKIYPDDMGRYWETVHVLFHVYPGQFYDWSQFICSVPVSRGLVEGESIYHTRA